MVGRVQNGDTVWAARYGWIVILNLAPTDGNIDPEQMVWRRANAAEVRVAEEKLARGEYVPMEQARPHTQQRLQPAVVPVGTDNPNASKDLRWNQRHKVLLWFIALAMMAVGVPILWHGLAVSEADPNAAFDGDTWSNGGNYTLLGAALAALPLFLCIWIWFWRRITEVEAAVAHRVPTPAEIYSQLEAEQGHPPSMTDVAAVHQMLTSQHNQELVQAGMTVAGLLMLRDAANRAKG